MKAHTLQLSVSSEFNSDSWTDEVLDTYYKTILIIVIIIIYGTKR